MEVQETKGSGGEGGIRTLDTGFSPYLAARISACGRIGTPSTWTRLEIFSAPFASFIETRCCIAGGGKARPLIFTDINSMEIQVARGHAGSLRSPRIFLATPD